MSGIDDAEPGDAVQKLTLWGVKGSYFYGELKKLREVITPFGRSGS